jgi:class 3 adenylate cyclase
MALEAINEQLLRAVGVGIALFDAETLALTFHNAVFASWIEEAAPDVPLAQVLPQLDLAALQEALAGRGRYSAEISLRKKRRTLVLAQIFTKTQVGDREIIVLECQNISRIRELEAMLESYSAMVERNTRQIQREKEQVEKLLLSILPKSAYEEYKSFGVVTPQRYENVSVLTLDLVDSSGKMETLPPATFVGELNEIYGAFDRIGDPFECERLKTTGDTYVCVAGMQSGVDGHEMAVANAAKRFVRYLRRRNENAATRWTCRIGNGSRPILGSVVATENYVYDVFGPALEAAVEARRACDPFEILVAPGMEASLAEMEMVHPLLEPARAAGFRALAAG